MKDGVLTPSVADVGAERTDSATGLLSILEKGKWWEDPCPCIQRLTLVAQWELLFEIPKRSYVISALISATFPTKITQHHNHMSGI